METLMCDRCGKITGPAGGPVVATVRCVDCVRDLVSSARAALLGDIEAAKRAAMIYEDEPGCCQAVTTKLHRCRLPAKHWRQRGDGTVAHVCTRHNETVWLYCYDD